MAVIDPIKLCCFRPQSEHRGPLCPTGTVMCCYCFDAFTPEELATDNDGQRIDVCQGCATSERVAIGRLVFGALGLVWPERTL